MRVVALVHYYVPFRCAGSETMLHTLLKALAEAGHEIQVFATDIPDAPYMYDYEGIRVVSSNWFLATRGIPEFDPDVIITHHRNTPRAIRLGKALDAKSVFLMHNDFKENRGYLAHNPDLTVFNTEWIRDATEHTGKSMVVHPPVWREDHETDPGDCVTLVNLNENKGSMLFYKLAEALPHMNFLGVVGGHGEQIVRNDLPNVEIVEHTDDMVGQVWSRTGVLLMPSVYESYGMAGIEAMASGIPVLAHPTPGLKESLSYAGTFLDRDDPQAWMDALEGLSEPDTWVEASSLAYRRSIELDPTPELNEWVSTIERLAR